MSYARNAFPVLWEHVSHLHGYSHRSLSWRPSHVSVIVHRTSGPAGLGKMHRKSHVRHLQAETTCLKGRQSDMRFFPPHPWPLTLLRHLELICGPGFLINWKAQNQSKIESIGIEFFPSVRMELETENKLYCGKTKTFFLYAWVCGLRIILAIFRAGIKNKYIFILYTCNKNVCIVKKERMKEKEKERKEGRKKERRIGFHVWSIYISFFWTFPVYSFWTVSRTWSSTSKDLRKAFKRKLEKQKMWSRYLYYLEPKRTNKTQHFLWFTWSWSLSL